MYDSTKDAERETGSSGGWQYGKGEKQIDVEMHYATREHLKKISKPVAKYSIAGNFMHK